MRTSEVIRIAGTPISPGARVSLDIELPQLFTRTPLTMPVVVVRGNRDGARLFVSAAVHGDELNGVEIIRRLLKRSALHRLRGTLIAIPMVNVYGVIHRSRYLPDRRDLNRSFPGSEQGSLASRLANVFMTEIVGNCTHGIDLHTGANHRTNLPQIRADLSDEETMALARLFGVPVLLNSNFRDGSLRQAAAEQGIPMLLYEAGEALRFDELSIRAGVQGIVNVMRGLGMLPKRTSRGRPRAEPFVARSSTWIRAPDSGIFRSSIKLGARINRGMVLGTVGDPFGESQLETYAVDDGIVIGRSSLPLVHEGEALFHLARFEDTSEVAEHVERFQTHHEQSISEPLPASVEPEA